MTTKSQLTDHESARELRNRALSYEIATEGVVLLENNGVLPLSPCPIALYGAGAQYTIKGGSGSGEVNARHNVSVLEGLRDAGFDILTNEWLKRYDEQWKSGRKSFLSSMRRKLLIPTARRIDALLGIEYIYPTGGMLVAEQLASTDTCIYVVARQSGEGKDREDIPGNFRLTDDEIANIRLCAAYYSRFVLLINSGAPIDLTPLDDIPGIGAIVYMGQLGMEGGHAVAHILTGKVNPSGKLAVTWPKSYEDVPFGNEFGKDPEHALYKEGIYVGYRYFDSFDVSPRYPFGYGLTYTSFVHSAQQIRLSDDKLICSVEVMNNGSRAGKNIVQAYVRCPGEDCEYQRLVAFAKTKVLQSKETEIINLCVDIASLAQYDESDAQTIVREGDYIVLLGDDSRSTIPVAVVTVPNTLILEHHKHLCQPQTNIAELHHTNRFEVPRDLPHISINSITRAEHSRVVAPLTGETSQFDVRLLAGTGMNADKNGFSVPGAVGHTTAAFVNEGVHNIEFCDGPAGLRLEKKSVLYPNGEIKPLEFSLSIYEYLPRWMRYFLIGKENKGQVLYQYVTAFPVEAMVAQTWNVELAQKMGEAISEEMSEYGVSFWLGPAMNIVRNPLCGRNYEYYSEDPLLTGRMASATAKGVESRSGNYCTLKHFCANNQEAYRRTVSSDVDERALREIYWRGFEIAIREAHPSSVMVAYNKLNGTYCATNHELCSDLLRDEWGFDGVIMTDWYSTGPDLADEAACISAGVDLIMPGGEETIQALTKAHKEGKLSDADINRATNRVLRAIRNTRR